MDRAPFDIGEPVVDRDSEADDPLCAKCTEWREAHTESRDADQRGLGDWKNGNR